MPELGRAALIVCLGLAVYAVVAGAVAAWQRRQRLAESAQNAVVASFAAALVGAGLVSRAGAATLPEAPVMTSAATQPPLSPPNGRPFNGVVTLGA